MSMHVGQNQHYYAMLYYFWGGDKPDIRAPSTCSMEAKGLRYLKLV